MTRRQRRLGDTSMTCSDNNDGDSDDDTTDGGGNTTDNDSDTTGDNGDTTGDNGDNATDDGGDCNDGGAPRGNDDTVRDVKQDETRIRKRVRWRSADATANGLRYRERARGEDRECERENRTPQAKAKNSKYYYELVMVKLKDKTAPLPVTKGRRGRGADRVKGGRKWWMIRGGRRAGAIMRGVGVVVVLLRGKDRMEMSDEEGECVDVRAMEKDGNRGNRISVARRSGVREGRSSSLREKGKFEKCSRSGESGMCGKKQEVGKDGNEVFHGNAKHLHEIERVWWRRGWLLRARERARTGVKIERVGMEQRRADTRTRELS
ncbi:hypothetical protein EDB84DRAFT_1634583 [Lactarius hengduanensis]|nr:hypothetical protein EDB84DRAFT_1634583 [Lactarius hengduanensis]